MKTILRKSFRQLMKLYPREHGKHTILTKIFFPYLAPSSDATEIVSLYNGLKIQLTPAEYLQGFLYNFGGYEFPSLRFIAKALQPGDVVLDIGAQIGFMSLVFAYHVGPEGKVFAFEPEKKNFIALQDNIALNNLANIVPLNMAVTAEPKTIRLFIGKGENTGVHSTVFNDRTMSVEFEDVPGLPIDRVIEEQRIPKIAFVKIDIEGAELPALQGMQALLERDAPLLLVEISAELQNLSGISVKHFKETLLSNYGYQSFTIDEQGCLHPSRVEAFHLNDNLAFIKSSRIDSYQHLFA